MECQHNNRQYRTLIFPFGKIAAYKPSSKPKFFSYFSDGKYFLCEGKSRNKTSLSAFT
jgi:hypothetical protein